MVVLAYLIVQIANFFLDGTVTVREFGAYGQTVRTKYLHYRTVFLNTRAVNKHAVPRRNYF